MDNYTTAVDKLFREIAHLDRALAGLEAGDEPAHVDLALANAKRVRTASTLLVRALARHRDHATGQEATST